MAKFGVTYYRASTDYGQRPERIDFGVVNADTADEAKDLVVQRESKAHAERADGSMFDPRRLRAFLTATALDSEDDMPPGVNIALEMEKVLVRMAATLGVDPGVGAMIGQAACVEILINKYVDDAFKETGRDKDKVREDVVRITCALLSNPSFTIGTTGPSPIDDLMAHLLRKSAGSKA